MKPKNDLLIDPDRLTVNRIAIRDKEFDTCQVSNKSNDIGNKGYDFFDKDKDKDNILVEDILGILIEDIFSQLILQMIRIKDSLRILKG